MTGEDNDRPRTYPAGVTCWIDTNQPDVDAACAFYGGLFGWTFDEAMPPGAPGRYVIAQLDGRDVAAIGSTEGAGLPAWNTYVAVDDADDATERVSDLGATVLSPPEDAGPGGRTSTIRDPQGCELRLWQARRRLGAQLTNVPGSWNFSDLLTSDADAATAFYTAAFGWRFVDEVYGTAIQVPGYGDHLRRRSTPTSGFGRPRPRRVFADVIGGLEAVPDGQPAHWHVTFTVTDRDATADLAQRLGGVVVSASDTGWSRRAVLRDPQGAAFTASQFTPPTSWDG